MLVMVLLIMLAVSGLAVQGAETASLEWRMVEQQRAHQALFEQAEGALEQLARQWSSQTHHALVTPGECGRHCVSPGCDQGLCFHGTSAGDWSACRLQPSTLPAPRQWPLWQPGALSGTAQEEPGVNIRWLLEFRCYAPADPEHPVGEDNAVGHVRLTIWASQVHGAGGLALRLGIALPGTLPGPLSGPRRLYWEQLDVSAY